MGRPLEEALKVLGIPADSDRERVSNAYRRLARATHPDVSPAPDAAERFAILDAAYRLVSAASAHPPNSGRAATSSESSESSLLRRSPAPRSNGTGNHPRNHVGNHHGTLVGDWANATPDLTRSNLLRVASPYLGAGPWGRPPIVAGPVILRRAPREGGVGEA